MKKFISLATAERISQVRGACYLHDCLNYGELDAQSKVIWFTEKAHAYLRKKYEKHDKENGLGDMLHTVLGPIGRVIHWPCNKRVNGVVTNELTAESPCDRMRKKLNNIKVP